MAPAEPGELRMHARLHSVRSVHDHEGLAAIQDQLLPIVAHATRGNPHVCATLLVSMAAMALIEAGATPAQTVSELETIITGVRSGFELALSDMKGSKS